MDFSSSCAGRQAWHVHTKKDSQHILGCLCHLEFKMQTSPQQQVLEEPNAGEVLVPKGGAHLGNM